MQVHRDINNLPFLKNTAVTIGTFDGVHSGHVKIIDQLKKEAIANNGESVIITFHPHPRMVVDSAKQQNTEPVHLLNTLDEKIELIAGHGVDNLVIVPFTTAFSDLSAEDYIQKFLVQKFAPKSIIIGYDHHFGKGRSGNYKMLEAFADSCNFQVKEIPQHILDHVAISSTRIREALTGGDVTTANRFLGYEYCLSGIVVKGDQIGRTLGYPTANLKIENEFKLVPANGIYIVEATLNKTIFKGMLSVGTRPAVGGISLTIEAHLLDFHEDIYNKNLRLSLKKYIRPELNFDNLESLIKKMKEDEEITRNFFHLS